MLIYIPLEQLVATTDIGLCTDCAALLPGKYRISKKVLSFMICGPD
jgi:hypothetical protein